MLEATIIHFVGLDVHRDTIVIAVARNDGRPAEVLATVAHDIPALIRRLRRLGPVESLRCCYEAGPTGFGLARRLNEAGIACEVIAPSLVPVQSGARVKLLISDWQAGSEGMRTLDSLAAVPGIEVRLSSVPDWSKAYIPFARVDHSKYMVVDTLVTNAVLRWGWVKYAWACLS